MSKIYTGGCLCGSIRFTATNPNNSHTCSCDISVGAIDDAPVIALLVGGFDDPNDADLAPEFHSFTDMQPTWWQKEVN